jgi:uncharacterized protein YyaL (SSP411 family)
MSDLNMNRNNLDQSSSPYLRQHISNPIWWQEWSADVIETAVRQGKPIFVSVGYATCHWCHVMAAEAFSDGPTADYLNRHFICIKVDREQRPDIDQFLMHFITAQNRSGGWPLNVFLTPRIEPIFALTYAPAEASGQMDSFREIARSVRDYYEKHAAAILPFRPSVKMAAIADEETMAKELFNFHDPVHGGFGTGQKFPPHTTLLYLLYFLCSEDNTAVREMCRKTLDAMRLRGLSDHLQGGIFRYCVDREWTIPHFEKMLYDQALALWCYALAYKVFGSEAYKVMAEGIIRCLGETFEKDGLFISGHDADTGHAEGGTYVWRYDDLVNAFAADELAALGETYHDINRAGNFEDAIHLIRKTDVPLKAIEDKLLAIRRKRPQPHTDDKILCGMNALTAAAFIQSSRLMGMEEMETKAAAIMQRLCELFWDGGTLAHSLSNGSLQKQSYLFDAAAMLFAVSLLYENDASWKEIMIALSEYLETFRDDDRWIESRAPDFLPVEASWFDHPTPSSAALAEMGISRVAILTGRDIQTLPYRHPFEADFHNVTAMIRNGLFHLINTQQPVHWSQLPPNTIQARGDRESDCYRGTCRVLQPQSGSKDGKSDIIK